MKNQTEKIIEILNKDYNFKKIKRDPFKVLISTILSQRTKDENTERATKKLFSVTNKPSEILKLSLKKIEKLIKTAGFYRNKAKVIKNVSKKLIKDYGGKVPDSLEELLKLKGVGRKTAGCVLVYAFNKPAIPVDVHVHRISNRIGLVNTRNPENTEFELMKIFPKKNWILLNNLFVKHGQNICKPINPLCGFCKIRKYCKFIH